MEKTQLPREEVGKKQRRKSVGASQKKKGGDAEANTDTDAQ